jgi:uncharacterized protein
MIRARTFNHRFPMTSHVEQFAETNLDPQVRGFLHRPADPNGDCLIFTHGAGGNSKASLLVAIAEVFSEAGFAVLRCDLPFRQARPFGPPRPVEAVRDRAGLRNAVQAVRKGGSDRAFLGGQSYGGRQATMLCADEPELVDGLLLTSYPLHPPGKPDRLRTEHFPALRTPALFFQGSNDPFGSIAEVEAALKLIPARARLVSVSGVGHDLVFRGKSAQSSIPAQMLAEFQRLFVQNRRTA